MGNARRRFFRPGIENFDATLSRSFCERHRSVEFASSFNLFNHAQFSEALP